MGKLQFDYLVDHGLKPDHYLLDAGCGPLRGGVHFIQYLEEGHYYGVDKREDVIEEARELELPRHGLAGKRPPSGPWSASSSPTSARRSITQSRSRSSPTSH